MSRSGYSDDCDGWELDRPAERWEVELRDIVLGDGVPGWLVWLVIGVQQFPIGDPHEDKQEADWYAAMLRKAITALPTPPSERVVYQCPRCATSMEIDPTAKPSQHPPERTADARWIPVGERLPEDARACVLAVTNSLRIVMVVIDFLRSNPGEYTHWMPIPPAPLKEPGR